MASKKTASVAGKPGASPVLPRVPLTVNDTTYHLVWSFNAIARAEQLTGVNMFAYMDFGNMSVTNMRAMLFAALLTEHPDFTLEQAGDLMQTTTITVIYEALLQSWLGSHPEKKDKDKANPPSAE